jgi:hypothetical protein
MSCLLDWCDLLLRLLDDGILKQHPQTTHIHPETIIKE